MMRSCVVRGLAALALLPLAVAGAPSRAHEGPHIVASLPAPGAPAGSPLDPSPGGSPPAASGARSTVDEPDAVAGKQTHAVYFVPRGTADEGLDTNGTLARSLDALLDWFRDRAGRRPRMDRIAGGTLDVTFVAGERSAAEYRSGDSFLHAIAAELARRGFAAPEKRYLVYAAVPSGSVCGEAFWPGRYAAVYLGAYGACGARDFAAAPSAAAAGRAEAIAAQEWLHNDGAVPAGAPHTCALSAAHVCTAPLALLGVDPEADDVMYPYVTRPLRHKALDRGRDDYFDHPWPLADAADSAWLE